MHDKHGHQDDSRGHPNQSGYAIYKAQEWRGYEWYDRSKKAHILAAQFQYKMELISTRILLMRQPGKQLSEWWK